MPPRKKIILKISPQTHVRTTQGDAILFRMPQDCPVQCGEPRRSKKSPLIEVIKRGKPAMVRAGCKHCLSEEGLARKIRIEKYNRYKEDLFDVAQAANFELPRYGAIVNFLVPVPPSWTKKKKAAMHFQMIESRPDLDNFLKALQDTLKKEDGVIGHYDGLGKYWINEPTGFIEILLTPATTSPVYRPYLEEKIR